MIHDHHTIAMSRKHAATGRASLPLWARIILRRLERIEYGAISIRFGQSPIFRIEGAQKGPEAEIHIHTSFFIWSLIKGGALGVAKAYMDDQFDTPDLSALLSFGIANEKELQSLLSVPTIRKLSSNIHHFMNANTLKGSRRNIAFHYDLGNDFYGQWLDETMTYSSALFTHEGQGLANAQNAKYDRIIKQLNIQSSDRVLEIGCGWGGFAEYAAKITGCHIVGLTLSVEQANFARQRMQNAGVAERVDIRIEDYRHCSGQFDKVVSIEMFEAVGEKNWPVYFSQLQKLLVPAGEALLQVITIDPERFQHYRKNADFIQTYIFPGGMLPPNQALIDEAQNNELRLCDQFMFGEDYEKTLLLWDAAFCERWVQIAPLGFDERFKRMWRYYLHYCAAGFRTKRIDVGQFHFRKG